MDYFITLTLVALLFIYLIPTRQEREERRRERDASRDLDDLNQEISQKEQQLDYLDSVLAKNQLDKKYNLTPLVESVLDRYDAMNIQLPVNILEEISATTWSDEHELIAYIEQQRNHWKLENQKKGLK